MVTLASKTDSGGGLACGGMVAVKHAARDWGRKFMKQPGEFLSEE